MFSPFQYKFMLQNLWTKYSKIYSKWIRAKSIFIQFEFLVCGECGIVREEIWAEWSLIFHSSIDLPSGSNYPSIASLHPFLKMIQSPLFRKYYTIHLKNTITHHSQRLRKPGQRNTSCASIFSEWIRWLHPTEWSVHSRSSIVFSSSF